MMTWCEPRRAWAVAWCAVLMLLPVVAQAQVVRPFSVRYQANEQGDVRLIGNTVVSCDTALSSSCASARDASTSVSLDNNDYDMRYVDVDADATTFNASRATLSLPAGAQVVFAGLYWGGELAGFGSPLRPAPTPNSRDRVRLRVPSSATYDEVTAQSCDNTTVGGQYYSCFADVTPLLAEDPRGQYTVANVQTSQGVNASGGWGMVLVYRDANEPTRNLVVYDGFAAVSSVLPTIDIAVSGFITPFLGQVSTRMGVIAHEGDIDLGGDQLRLNGVSLSDGANPTSNFFNSTSASFGAPSAGRSPAYANLMGFDVDLVDATGILANNATSAQIRLETSGDFYYPAVVTFATEVYAPELAIKKTVADLNGGDAQPGDLLEYRFEVENLGPDPADDVLLLDLLPAAVIYEPGSLRIDGQARTDAPGDDPAEYDPAAREVVLFLGTGATATRGGSLTFNQTTVVTFQARIRATVTANTPISNQAISGYVGRTLGTTFFTLSDDDPTQSGQGATILYVDSTPPVVSIEQPAAQSVVSAARPEISGVTEPGAALTLRLNGGAITPVMVDPITGAWRYTPPVALSDGPHSVQVTATDTAGNSAQATTAFRIDTTSPAVIITRPINQAQTSEVRPRFEGSSEPGATVTLRLEGAIIATILVPASGQWSHTQVSALLDGPYQLQASAQDAVGNAGQTSVGFTVDTLAPPVAFTTPAPGALLDTTTPTLRGTTQPGATVRVSLDGGPQTPVSVDAQGVWSLNSPSLSQGAHQAQAVASDAAGNTSSATRDFTIDTVPPALTLTAPADQSLTRETRPMIAGSAEPGSALVITLDGQVIAQLTVPMSGQWSAQPSALTDGPHQLVVVATDAANNSSQASAAITVDTTAPALTIIAPAPDATLASARPTLSGSAEPNSAISVRVDGVEVYTAQVGADGLWSVTLAQPLGEGAHGALVIATDAAGNSAQRTRTFTIDTSAPSLVIHTPQPDAALAQASPVITGMSEPNVSVTITVRDAASAVVFSATLSADASGAWSSTVTGPLGDGAYSASATATDAVGNSASDSVSFSVDLTPPALAITAPAQDSITNNARPSLSGTSDAGQRVAIWLDGALMATVTADDQGQWLYRPELELSGGDYTVEARASDALGNEARVSVDFTIDTSAPNLTFDAPAQGAALATTQPTLTGSADPGATVTLTLNGAPLATVTADAQGQWTHAVSQPLAEGAYVAEAQTANIAGTTARAGVSFILDVTAPMVTLETPADDSVLADALPVISGLAEPGAQIEVSIDGEVVATVTANQSGRWVYTPQEALEEGAHEVTVVAIDAAGNSASVSASFSVDLTPPPLRIDAPADGSAIAERLPELRGETAPLVQVTLTLDMQPPMIVVSDAQGQWRATPQAPLADGEHALVASVDAGAVSVTSRFVVDLSAPDLTITSPTPDGVLSVDGVITGTAEPGSVVIVTVDGGAPVTVEVGADGQWSHTPEPLEEGAHAVTVTATDAAGNQASLSVDFTVEAPEQPVQPQEPSPPRTFSQDSSCDCQVAASPAQRSPLGGLLLLVVGLLVWRRRR